MKLTRVEAQRLLDQFETRPKLFPLKYHVDQLRETINELFDQQETLTDEIESLNNQIFEMGMGEDL